ncbi:MAG: Non-canonical purine NTP pyrophosphatase [Chlamydiae bacterium]|nr:Non-canonical purine NTP pyrophosphatase [Chlamydiota bacterium]
MELVLATNNLHKIREIREMLKGQKNIDILSLLNFSDYKPEEEKGKTFAENAALKAEHAAKALNKWVLADDSGLVVPALNDRPGVISRRYAGDDATDAENCHKLLEDMETMEDLKRAAYFECCLVLANPEGLVKSVTGKVEGMIITEEKGNSGFGYDPVFLKNDYDKTFAELDESTKNRISHRRKALDKLLSEIEALKD